MNIPEFYDAAALTAAQKSKRTRILKCFASHDRVLALLPMADDLLALGDGCGASKVLKLALALSYPDKNSRHNDDTHCVYARVAAVFGSSGASQLFFSGLSEYGVRYENQLNFAASIGDADSFVPILFKTLETTKENDIAKGALSHLLVLGRGLDALDCAAGCKTRPAYEALIEFGFHAEAVRVLENIAETAVSLDHLTPLVVGLIRHGRIERAGEVVRAKFAECPDSRRRRILALYADAAGDDAASDIAISHPGAVCEDLFSSREESPEDGRKPRFMKLALWAFDNTPELRPSLFAHMQALREFDKAADCLVAHESLYLTDRTAALAEIGFGARAVPHIVEDACVPRADGRLIAEAVSSLIRHGERTAARACALELVESPTCAKVLARVADTLRKAGILDVASSLFVAARQRAVTFAEAPLLEELGHLEDAANAYEKVTGDKDGRYGYNSASRALADAGSALARLGRIESAVKKYRRAIQLFTTEGGRHLVGDWEHEIARLSGASEQAEAA